MRRTALHALLIVMLAGLAASEIHASPELVKGAALKCHIGCRPHGAGLEKLIGLKRIADGYEIDFRPAFAAGASKGFVFIDRNWSLSRFEGTDVGLAVELTGFSTNSFAQFSIVPEGRYLNGGHWWTQSSQTEVLCAGRHRYVGGMLVPGNSLKDFHTRLDFDTPGDAPFRLHLAEADFYAVASDDDTPVGVPRVVFHAPLDGSAVARIAGGRAEPIATNGLKFVKGYRGQALKCDDELATKLVYEAKGNVNPLRGSFSCWMMRDWAEKNRLGFRDGRHYHAHFRNLFNVSNGGEPQAGDGHLRIWWKTAVLNWERGAYGKHGHAWGPTHLPYRPNEWVHVVFTWNERETQLYVNGDTIPPGRISDKSRPVDAALFKPPLYRFAEDWRDALRFMEIGCGSRNRDCPWNGLIDDVRIWSEALTYAQVKKLYAAETNRKESNGLWEEPWSEPKEPLPANAALKAATGGEPGVLTGLELVHDIRPAEIARRGDKDVFAAASKWRIGKFDGEEYLEAGEGLCDRWAIRLRLDPKVPLWCVEVTYPDDRARAIDMVLQNTSYPHNDYCLNAGIETGLEHPLTMKNATKRYLYWARQVPNGEQGDCTFIAMTQTKGDPAAISRIRLYAIRDGRIPDAGVVEPPKANGDRRHFAMWFEDPAIMYDFGTTAGKDVDWKLLIDRIAAYMKFIGQDTFIYPGAWYAGLIGTKYQPRPHASHYWRELARRFDRDGLGFVPSVNQQWFPELNISVTRKAMTDGSLHPTALSIHSTGCPNWGGWHHTPTYYNIAHPDVQAALLGEVAALCEECRDYGSFRGVAFDNFNSICVTWWGNIEAGYNDYCIAAFEKAKGVKVPRNGGPLRGKVHAEWLKANAYEKWVQWRCDVVTDLYRRVAEIVRRARPDLKLYVRNSAGWLSGTIDRDDLDREDITDRIYREAGIDCTALGKIPNVVIAAMSMPAFWRDELARKSQANGHGPRVRDLPESEGYMEPTRRSAYPMADFHDSYYESPVGSASKKGNHVGDGRLRGAAKWLEETGWRVTAFSPSGREALRPYAKALKYGDVLAFGRGGFQLGTCGDEAVTAPFMKAFRSLPAVKFADVAGFSHEDVRVRHAKVGGADWFYAINTGFKPVEIDLPKPFGKTRLDSYELKVKGK